MSHGQRRDGALAAPDRRAESAVPALAVDAKGNAAAVWTSVTRGNVGTIKAALKPSGGAWGPARTLAGPPGRSFAAQVVFDSRGDAVMAWLDYAASTIRGSTQAPGGHRGKPVTISRPGGHAGGPALAVDGRGNTIAAWTTFERVATAMHPTDGDWHGPVDIARQADAFETPVALDAAGDAVAVWIGDDGGSEQGSMRAAGGNWQTPVGLASRMPGAEASGAGISLAVDPAGRNAVVVWSRAVGPGSVVPSTSRQLR